MQAKAGICKEPEMKAISPTLAIQDKNSTLPEHDQFLIEKTFTKEGVNWFLFLLPADWRMKVWPPWSVIVCPRLFR